MKHPIFEIQVPDSGYIDFQTTIPHLRGKKIKLVLIEEPYPEMLSLQDIEKTIDEDWSDWLNSQEDIYEEYREFISEG